ncbi:MAG: sugar phosphate isomerase/epimerase family protein [Deinococcota bacterium]
MVQFGAHAFVWIGEWTLEAGNAAIRDAARLGFDFIEIPLLDPDTFNAEAHRAVLEEVGISAACSLVLPKDAHMPHVPDKAIHFLIRALDQVEALGSNYLGGCIAYSLGTLTGKPPTQDEKDKVTRALIQVDDYAQSKGIRLALEACNRYETYMYNSLADTRAAVLAVDSDNLKLHADTYHMNIEEEGFYKPIVETGDVLDYIHMSESHRGYVGSGTVNWDDAWRALGEINFSGSLVLESFAAINPALAAATCLWRPPNEPSEKIAKDGLAFLKDSARQHGLLTD